MSYKIYMGVIRKDPLERMSLSTFNDNRQISLDAPFPAGCYFELLHLYIAFMKTLTQFYNSLNTN